MIPSRKNTVRAIHTIDASDEVLGRLASRIALLLRGKNKPTFQMHLDEGDFVKIVNASKVRVTGQKLQQKVYQHHTWHPGGLKTEKMAEMIKRDPTEPLKMAVLRMLPRNKLRAQMIKRLTLEA